MKVLFLSHYKNSNKLGSYAQGLMLALHKAGVELVFRHIENGKDKENKLHPILMPLEQGLLDECTHCVQFLQSEYILSTDKFVKNIVVLLEPIKNMYELRLFDEVWVFEDSLKKLIQLDHPEISIKVITPVLTDIKDKLEYIYKNQKQADFESFSLNSVGVSMKEALYA